MPFEAHPVVMWELTRACDLHCRNCTIGATENRGTNELTTYEAYKTIDQIAGLTPREVIMTGGDPLERGDVDQIVNYARRRGLDPALVVSPTSHLTSDAIASLERNGLTRIVISIDGSVPEIHEAGHGVAGTFDLTLRSAGFAREAGLAVEVNTLITRQNAGDLPAIAALIRSMGIVRWNLYFLVPLKTSYAGMISAEEAEQAFATIDEIRGRETFLIRVVEAPQYRRFRLQRSLDARLDNAANANWSDFSGYEANDAGGLQSVMESARDGAAIEERAHVGYYLVGAGVSELESEFAYRPKARERRLRALLAHPTRFYLGTLALLTALVVAALVFGAYLAGAGWPLLAALALLSLIPASELAVSVLNWDVTHAI